MKKHFSFYWGGVSTAKEENPAGSMMSADNQKVALIFFLPSTGFLAAASLSVSWDRSGSSGPQGVC